MIFSLQYQYISKQKRNEKKVKKVNRGILSNWTPNYILFEITGDPCTVIGSHRCDLFKNLTIFFSLDGIFFSAND